MSVKTSSNDGLNGRTDTEESDAADDAPDASTEELSKDQVFHLLQNERRRRVLRYLRAHDDGDGVDMRDVVEQIAAEEHDTTVQALRSKERQRVYIALYQSHLPKLDDEGVIDYDQRRGWVSRTPLASTVDPYLEGGPADADEERPEEESKSGSTTDVAATGAAATLVLAAWTGVFAPMSAPVAATGVFALLCASVLGRRSR